MNELTMSQEDEIIIKLLHYFITVENYSPIVLKGAKNEIWLEKLDADYKVVRLVSNYIHNNEQLNTDLYRTKQIMKRIKKKTMSFSINALSIFVNLGDNVEIDKVELNDIACVKLKDMDDLKSYEFLMDEFPQITKQTKYKEEGMELFIKLTDEIGKKNDTNQKQAELLFSKKDPIVTKILLIINFIVFLLSILFGSDFIINVGSNYKPYVLNGQFYRLITSGFIHIDLIHFLCNMYALYVIGPQIENFFGKVKYLLIYFGSIIIASLLSLVFLKEGISFGASGAIFGLLGSLLYFGYHYRVYLDGVIKSQIIPIIVLNLFLGFMLNGIDNAGHIGGLIGGILLAMACGVPYKSKKQDIINGINLTLIFTAFLVILLFNI